MTAKQFHYKVERLLESVKRRVENSSEEEIKAMRKKLREDHELIFVNARPYFRQYRPRPRH
jgi:hypothetical protein